LKRGGQSEQQPRHYRRAEGEQEHAPIETDFVYTRNQSARYCCQQNLRSPGSEQHAGRAADERQQNAFSQ